MKKALFLDRDGVINADTGHPHRPEHITFIDGIFDFCRKAHAVGYLLIVVTNQAGIGKGMYTEEDFEGLMHWMQDHFVSEDCPLSAWYFCPHHPDAGCGCRKPKPGMILQAAKDWDIDLEKSLLVGDNATDIEAGKAAGVGRVELFSGTFPGL